MSILKRIIYEFKKKNAGNCKKLNTLEMIGNHYERKIECLEDMLDRKNKEVAFCMRCFSNSAVPIDKGINFCHNCGSGGTCIPMTSDESEYLRQSIRSAVERES